MDSRVQVRIFSVEVCKRKDKYFKQELIRLTSKTINI